MMVVTTQEVVGDAIFIHLKMPTRSAKISKEEAKWWSNNALSTLNLKK
jgi:hypothetical protein